MSLWDNIKKHIPSLIDIKTQLAGRDLNIGGTHYHVYNLPAELVSKLEHTSVTPEMQKEFEQKTEQKIKAIEDRIKLLPQTEIFREVVINSGSSAIEVITGTAHLELPMFEIKAVGTSDRTAEETKNSKDRQSE